MKTAGMTRILLAVLVSCIGLSLSPAYAGEGPSNVRGSLPENVYQKLTSVFPTAKWWVEGQRAAAHGLTEYILEMKIGSLELKVTMDSTGKIVAVRTACHDEGHATERKGHDDDSAKDRKGRGEHGEREGHGEHGESRSKRKDIFAGGKNPGVEWDGTVWYLESDPERLFVNSDGDLEWTPKGRERFVTNIPTQCLSHVGDVVEKTYMFMSDGKHDCEDCLKCPDSCFDDDITCLAGTSDIRVGFFQSVPRDGDSDGYKGFKGYNFRFGPNMMAGPTRLVDCTDEVHKTGMFGKKPAAFILDEILEPPSMFSLVLVIADLMISLFVIPVRILNASRTETPATSKVDVVRQKVATKAWLMIFPNMGIFNVILLNQ